MTARLSKSDRKIMFARELRKREQAGRERCLLSEYIPSKTAAKTNSTANSIADWFTGLSLIVGLFYAGTFLLAAAAFVLFLLL